MRSSSELYWRVGTLLLTAIKLSAFFGGIPDDIPKIMKTRSDLYFIDTSVFA